MESTKPTIILVQGAFCNPRIYELFREALRKLHYTVVHPDLPTLNPELKNTTLADDVVVIQAEISKVVEAGETCVLVMHSFGGIMGSNSVPEELSFSWRQGQGLPGGVRHLYYIAAVMIPVGESVESSGAVAPYIEHISDGRMIVKDVTGIFFSDFGPETAKYWESTLISQSHGIMTTRTTVAAYKYIPSTYLICETDKAVPIEYQEAYIQTIGAEVDKIQTGHFPMLTKPEETASRIDAVVRSMTGQP